MASDLEFCPKIDARLVYIYGEVFIWKRTVFGKNNREGGLCHTLFVAVIWYERGGHDVVHAEI